MDRNKCGMKSNEHKWNGMDRNEHTSPRGPTEISARLHALPLEWRPVNPLLKVTWSACKFFPLSLTPIARLPSSGSKNKYTKDKNRIFKSNRTNAGYYIHPHKWIVDGNYPFKPKSDC